MSRTARPDGPDAHDGSDPTLPAAQARLERLRQAPLTVLGRLLDSSNATLLVRLEDGSGEHAVYKPIAGERPLWDFPDGHLAHREVAAWLVAQAGGWDLIPPTVLRGGPFGPGSVQLWVTQVPAEADEADATDETDAADETDDAEGAEGCPAGEVGDVGRERRDRPDAPTPADEREAAAQDIEVDTDVEHSDRYVDAFDPREVPRDWLAVLSGQLEDHRQVVVAHADRADLRSVAVLDAVLNNSDRKGTHLLAGTDGRLWGIDHGLTMHHQDKLRTVLWGWAGSPLAAADRARLDRLAARLAPDAPLTAALEELLTLEEIDALRGRVRRLRRRGSHPYPSSDWPSVPWPAL